MVRTSLLGLILGVAAHAAIWPEDFAGAKRLSAKPVVLTDPKLWAEYGFEEGETADYKTFQATAWRLQDSTGAMAAFQWQRPGDATPSKLAKLAAETPKGVVLAHGNYLFRIDGIVPQAPDLALVLRKLPRLEESPLPALTEYLPKSKLVSSRYAIGPESLARFEPRIPPSAAAFHLGTEVQLGTFSTPSGDTSLAIFSFPTPTIARERQAEFQKLPGALAKRTGPLVAVIVASPDANEAEKLLAQIKYKASISWSEYVPSRRDNIGDLVINAFILVGILLAFTTVSGLAFGWFRVLRRRGRTDEPDALTTLHLGGQ